MFLLEFILLLFYALAKLFEDLVHTVMENEHAICFDEFLQVLFRQVAFNWKGNMNKLE